MYAASCLSEMVWPEFMSMFWRLSENHAILDRVRDKDWGSNTGSTWTCESNQSDFCHPATSASNVNSRFFLIFLRWLGSVPSPDAQLIHGAPISLLFLFLTTKWRTGNTFRFHLLTYFAKKLCLRLWLSQDDGHLCRHSSFVVVSLHTYCYTTTRTERQ